MEPRIPKPIDAKLKERLYSLALDYFSDKQEISITKFNTDVIMKSGINYKEYVTSGKSMLKRFIMLFPDIFNIEERNINGGTVYYCSLKSTTRISIKKAIMNLLQKHNGKMPLSALGPALSAEYELDYKTYSYGKGLQAWLKSDYPDSFVIDGYNLLLATHSQAPANSSQSEIAQMHSVSFMSWWVNNAKVLQKYTNQSKSSDEWSAIVARGLANAILGVTPLFHYTTDSDIRIVFDTGIKTASGNSLYCVLKAKPDISTQKLQQFTMENFCCIAEEDNELSNQVKQNVPDILKSDSAMEDKYEELRKDLELLIQLRSKIASLMPALTEAVTTGTAIDAEPFAAVKAYYDRWIHANDIIEYLGWDAQDISAVNIDYLANRLEYTNRKNDVFNRAVDMFAEFANQLAKYCDDNGLEPMCDIIKKDIQAVENMSPEYCQDIRSIIEYYIRLIDITEHDSLTDHVAENLEIINQHFESSLSPKILKLLFYKKTAEKIGISSKSVPADVISLLSSLDTILAVDDEESQEVVTDADQIFCIATGDISAEAVANILSYVGFFPSSRLEKSIITGDYGRCTILIGNGELPDNYHRTKEELLHAIDELRSDGNAVFTMYECGMRLYRTLGNLNRTAEKYFIAGLISDPVHCSQALLDLYFAENEAEKFYTIWEKYCQKASMSPNKIKYLLYLLASKGEDILKQYLQKNICIFYVPEYMHMLNELLKDYDYTELIDMSDRCTAYIRSLPDMNDFEKQVISSGDGFQPKKTAEYISSSLPLMESMGYSDDELQSMTNLLAFSETGQENQSPVSMLYRLQKNKNGTVEKLIWDTLMENYDEDSCTILLDILADGGRYDELCLLFECYEQPLTKVSAARELYINGLIKTSGARWTSFVCDNIQDCMNMLSNGRLSTDDLHRAADSLSTQDAQENDRMCKDIINLCRYLDDAVVSSIIILSDDLRDVAINTGKLTDLGMDTSEIENFVSVYKTDSFSRGRDVLSVAERLYAFVGCSGGAARDFALLALKRDTKALHLLWKIYTDTNDVDAKLELFSAYPEYQQGKEQEYCSLLLHKKEYKKFIEQVQALDTDSSELAAQSIIAKCHLGKDISKELARLDEGIGDVSSDSLIGMLEGMADAKLYKEAEDFLVAHFDEVLSLCSADKIESIVTANGSLSADNLKTIQKSAQSKGAFKLAVYLYENFGIGRLKGASKQYLSDALSDCKTYDDDRKRALLQHLRIIYAKNNGYSVQIILSQITDILSSDDDERSMCEKIENSINDITLAADGVMAFMTLLKEYNLPITEGIGRSVIHMCKDAGLKKECIEFFSAMPSFCQNQNNTDMLYMLCDLYSESLREGYFDTAWVDSASDICTRLISTQYFCSAAYCMYNIQKHFGNMTYAKYNLLVLLEKKHEIPKLLLEEIEAQAQEMQITDKTSIFDLFVEMADSSSLGEIEAYCRYCGQYVTDKDALLKYYNEICSDEAIDSYTVESCIVLLKLLYTSPNNAGYWSNSVKMPLDASPVVYTKLLYKACMLNNKENMWKKCIDACERYCQEELLMDVLTDCAANTPMPYGLQNLRALLAEKVNTNPLYFSQLDDKGLARLISIICERMAKDPVTGGAHNAIRDLSAIAIATDSADAYTTMINYAERYIFGENSNVGLAIACRLILRKRLSDAKEILQRLSAISTVKYKKLITKLSEMDISELAAWSSESVNSQLLRMILPDGNYPDIHRINDFALSYTSGEKAEDGAMLICELLDNMPNDYGCHMALFILCKQLPHRLDILHKALCGLISNEPVGNSRSYYTRTRKDFAVLLANLNAVIISQKKTDEISAFDGYDFRVSAREYYQKYESDFDNLQALTEIQQAQDNIQNALMNRSAESCEIIYDLVFGYITGNWCDFLEICWRNDTDIMSYLDYYSAINNGMARSILRVAYSLDQEQQNKFISWISSNMAADGNKGSLQKQAASAISLYSNDYHNQIPMDIFEQDILELPFEEYSIFTLIYRNTVLQVISKAPASVYPCAMLVSYLAYSNGAMSEFWQTAMQSLESSNDIVANKLFTALHELFRKEKICHNRYENNPYKTGEIYESLMRVTGVFAGNANIINAVSQPDFNPWSCINMVFALLYTNRANEVNRLKQCFCEDNQRLTDVILAIINKNNIDINKLEAVRSLPNEVSRGLMCFILKFWDRSKKNYVFLSSADSVDIASKMLENVALRNTTAFGAAPKYSPQHFLWVEPSKIHENAYTQIENDITAANYEVVDASPADDGSREYTLSFVSSLEPLKGGGKSIDELWKEHENINSFGTENYQLRLDISQKIYRLALGDNASDDLLSDYAIRYGIDYYYYCMGKNQYSTANNIIIEMVNVFDPGSSSEGANMLKSTVCNTALHEILRRGYSSIRTMVGGYINNRQAFVKMRNMIPASTMSIELNDVNCIYAALESLAKCMSETSSSHTSALRKALVSAKNQLGDSTPQGWSSVRLSVLQMIQDEINKVDQRPILSFEIISKSSNRPYGYIYGQVKNIGNDVASNITIQLDYNNGFVSNTHVLSALGKDEVATFEVNYSAPSGTQQLDYDILVTYDNKGEKYNYIEKSTLVIKETEYVDFPTGLYLADRPIGDFVALDDGTIYSANFFGRDEEKKKVHSIFGSNSFVNYKNVIIKGIRRAGKTSILNYLLKYANTKCSDTIAIYVTCEGVKGDNKPIQHILVDSVLKECRALNIGDKSEQDWDSFVQKWELPEDAADRNADDLQYFYRDLKALNGNKGLMLVIDEFDILIEEVEKSQGVYSTLLPSLRVLINSVYCQEAIHLVICGSNKLIRYMDGGTLNQLFQQFGDNVIEIGRLLERDMKNMLCTPYLEYPSVEITSAALGWIWKYTSGLVWYSKLIANCALNRARSQERCIVYPSDVADAVTTVISNDEYFKSLVTSCRPKEMKILDAIQSLTAKATEYVSLSTLVSLLSDEFSKRDIEGIINTLERMQIVQRNPYDRYSYRFAVELYWHYFRVQPSNHTRCEEIPVKFKEGKTAHNAQSDDDY